MSNERDELARLIAGTRFKAGTRRQQSSLEQADAILAAGYRKVFEGDCGLSNLKGLIDRETAEVWIAAMKQMLTEFGYQKATK